ncbi:MAG TPA: hypothetical protein VH684_06070 [Xanthobacteraceae bacterium]
MKNTLAFVLACLSLAQPAFAQEQQQSFRSLMGRAYEIKGVTFAHGESTENRDTFVVTLQKDKSVAVCYFSSNAWINLTAFVLDDPKRCEVR